MTERVHSDIHDGIACLRIEAPQGQALIPSVRAALLAALDAIAADPSIQGVVLGGPDGGFPGAVELAEFDTGLAEPTPSRLAERIEGLGKPVVALLSGTVDGAGAEIALAAAARIAVAGALIGFREVTAGMPPNAGATQRLPRLLGARHALSLLLTGRAFPVDTDAARGLFAAVGPADGAQAAAVALAQRLAARGWVPTRDRREGFADAAAYTAEIGRRRGMVHADRRVAAAVVQAVEAAPMFPFEAGQALESDLFQDLASGLRARGLRHAATAEARVAAGIDAPPIGTVGLLSVQGDAARIAAQLARAGIAVQVEVGEGQLRDRFDAEVRRQVTAQAHFTERSGDAVDRVIARVIFHDGEGTRHGAGAPGPVEALIDPSADTVADKTAALSAVPPGKGPILSLTRGLDVAAMAAPENGGRVIGLHLPHRPFPAHLAELSAGPGTDPETLATARRLMVQLGRLPITVTPDPEGRAPLPGPAMLDALHDACDALVLLGLSPDLIDMAHRDRGWARGPYELISTLDADALADRQDTRGRAGGLSGRIARAGLRPGTSRDRAAEAAAMQSLVTEARGGRAVTPQDWTADEIWTATLTALVNRGAALLAGGRVDRPLALDVAMVQGYGFPRTEGGPMMAADLARLFPTIRAMQALAPLEPDLWTPHPMLVDLQKHGRRLSDLNG